MTSSAGNNLKSITGVGCRLLRLLHTTQLYAPLTFHMNLSSTIKSVLYMIQSEFYRVNTFMKKKNLTLCIYCCKHNTNVVGRLCFKYFSKLVFNFSDKMCFWVWINHKGTKNKCKLLWKELEYRASKNGYLNSSYVDYFLRRLLNNPRRYYLFYIVITSNKKSTNKYKKGWFNYCILLKL